MKKPALTAISVMAVFTVGVLPSACSEENPEANEISHSQQVVSTVAAAAGEAVDTAPSDYNPEALETLLAPVALYPDPVLAQVLATATNPQEVLDGGNWLLQNQGLTGTALEKAATDAGFTPAMVALIQFPTVVDMMCMEMDWTTELGSAFLADEPGVLSAVQRLRKQAEDMGNLKSSEEMKVATEVSNNQEVIIIQPATPEIVYVPQYNPAAVYTTPASTTTTTTITEGHSTESLVATGLLAFGAGILVANIFEDDNDYYYPRWGYGYGYPRYYPAPYYPRYGNGYRPAHDYRRPANYQHGFNNNNVYINTKGDNYFNRFDSGRNNYRNKPNSPISSARPNRSELGDLNRRPDTRPAQGSYAGARPKPRENPITQRPTSVKAPTGTYAGAQNRPNVQNAGARDRGHIDRVHTKNTARPTPAANSSRPKRQASPAGFRGQRDSGRAERAASQRGRASMARHQRPSARNRSGGNRGGRR